MPSPAQIQANRLNAQKSTGPRTPQGKATVAQNALKHGLRARQAVIVGEDPGQFETHRDQLLAELAPQGPLESTLAHRAVGLTWRLQRAERLQNQAFDALHAKETTSPLARFTQSLRPPTDSDPDLTLGRVVAKDFASTRVLDRLLMYERRLEHSLYKTLAELQRLRLLRANGLAVLSGTQWSRTDLPPQQAPAPQPTTAPPPPNRAKQTQFPKAHSDRNHLPTNRLRPHTPFTPVPEQTQSPRSKDPQRHGGYPKNRCENTTRRLIVETEAPPARNAPRRETTTPITKGNLA